ncbi:hypothetical protein C0991_004177, partial [Blastosporella zonata]
QDKKREKIRSEQAAQRKKKMMEPVVLDGPKRGNGRAFHIVHPQNSVEFGLLWQIQ